MSNTGPLPLELLRKLPKAELHRHLDGSVRPSTILELAKEQGVELPTYDLEELTKIVSVTNDCDSLVEYLRGFEITGSVLQVPYALSRVVYEVCEDALRDGVTYLEIRFSPVLHVNKGLTLSQVMEAVVSGLSLVKYRLHGITAQIIVCGLRHLGPEVTNSLAEIAWRYSGKGVCSFDLAGPEAGFSSKFHKDGYKLVRSKMLNTTVHSGEAAGWESIFDAIRHCGAHRIGHGTRLKENPKLLETVVERGIAIETCITSNIQTKAIPNFESHPFRDFFDAGVVVVPCCDNTTTSNVLLSTEYEIYQRLFDLTPQEIVRVIDYGFASAFLEPSFKHRLRLMVLMQCHQLLAEYGYDTTDLLNHPQFFDTLGLVQVKAPHLLIKPADVFLAPKEPVFTAEIVRSIPKADLHCRFDASVSLDFIWAQIQSSKMCKDRVLADEVPSTKEELRERLLESSKSYDHGRRARSLCRAVLQTKEQLRGAAHDVFEQLVEDGVVYVEFVIRPACFTRGGLSHEEVMTTLVEAFEDEQKTTGVAWSIVVYASTTRDDPIAFRQIAKLAVNLRDRGVRGFGVYGPADIPPEGFSYFQSTFEYLKENCVNIVISAGHSTHETVVQALLDGGATRISGGFQAHNDPTLMQYIANHNITIEMALSDKLAPMSAKVETFAGNLLQLFWDQRVRVAVCSFSRTHRGATLTSSMLDVIEKLSLSTCDAVRLLSIGFRKGSFCPSGERASMFSRFLERTAEILQEQGFRNLRAVHFQPPSPTSD